MANNISDPRKIRPGQELVIPGYTAVGGAAPATRGATCRRRATAGGDPAARHDDGARGHPAAAGSGSRFRVEAAGKRAGHQD